MLDTVKLLLLYTPEVLFLTVVALGVTYIILQLWVLIGIIRVEEDIRKCEQMLKNVRKKR